MEFTTYRTYTHCSRKTAQADADAHLANWELNATDDGKLQMKRNDDALLVSWDELRVRRGQNNISVPFTKDNFVSEMERFNDFFIGNER